MKNYVEAEVIALDLNATANGNNNGRAEVWKKNYTWDGKTPISELNNKMNGAQGYPDGYDPSLLKSGDDQVNANS